MKTHSSMFGVLVCALVVFGVAGSPVAHGEGPVIRSGSTIGVEADQVLKGDFYALGEQVTISGTAEGDAYVLGGSVTVNAPVKQDLVVLGGTVQVHAPVSDDVRVIGGDVLIAEPVTDDLFVIGGNVRILSTATIGGDLVVYSGEVLLEGALTGNMYGAAEQVRIDAPVGGSVHLTTGTSLTLGNKADVAGSVRYTSGNELTRAPESHVSGTIERTAPTIAAQRPLVEVIVFNVLLTAFSALTLFFLARSRVTDLVRTALTEYGRFGLVGLGMVLALPFLAILLIVSVIGSVVGLVVLVSYLLILAIAALAAPLFLGAVIQRLIRQGDELSVFTIAIGVFATCGLLFVPVVGAFILFLTFLILVGAVCTKLYTLLKQG